MPSPTGPSPTAARLPSLFGRHAVLSLRPAAPATGRTLPRHPMRNPRRVSRAQGLAILRFRSPLLTECPFLQVLRCFTSLRTPPRQTAWYPPMTAGGFPHSETPGSKPGWRLPGAYRCLQRPSSVPCAKASTMSPYRHDDPRQETGTTPGSREDPTTGAPNNARRQSSH